MAVKVGQGEAAMQEGLNRLAAGALDRLARAVAQDLE